jgi:PST family polysaccharide transporter
MFRTSSRMSDSLSRATGRVYRRAWRQGLYAAFVFLGALIGQAWGVTGVAVGVLAALLANYLLMAHLSLTIIDVSWAAFSRAQIPAVRLTLLLAVVTLAVTAVTRGLGLPPTVGLLLGTAAAAGTAVLSAWLIPRLTLGENGIRMRDTLRDFVRARLRPAGAGGSV